jgi:hypothetical protein
MTIAAHNLWKARELGEIRPAMGIWWLRERQESVGGVFWSLALNGVH